MSRRAFIRRFEDATGMSPGEWVVQARLAKARELLEGTNWVVCDTSQQSGFDRGLDGMASIAVIQLCAH
jgi:AraC family transcriptional activator FtrA